MNTKTDMNIDDRELDAIGESSNINFNQSSVDSKPNVEPMKVESKSADASMQQVRMMEFVS